MSHIVAICGQSFQPPRFGFSLTRILSHDLSFSPSYDKCMHCAMGRTPSALHRHCRALHCMMGAGVLIMFGTVPVLRSTIPRILNAVDSCNTCLGTQGSYCIPHTPYTCSTAWYKLYVEATRRNLILPDLPGSTELHTWDWYSEYVTCLMSYLCHTSFLVLSLQYCTILLLRASEFCTKTRYMYYT
jgi:hypothetical protein